jgi:hypothetical protein
MGLEFCRAHQISKLGSFGRVDFGHHTTTFSLSHLSWQIAWTQGRRITIDGG